MWYVPDISKYSFIWTWTHNGKWHPWQFFSLLLCAKPFCFFSLWSRMFQHNNGLQMNSIKQYTTRLLIVINYCEAVYFFLTEVIKKMTFLSLSPPSFVPFGFIRRELLLRKPSEKWNEHWYKDNDNRFFYLEQMVTMSELWLNRRRK